MTTGHDCVSRAAKPNPTKPEPKKDTLWRVQVRLEELVQNGYSAFPGKFWKEMVVMVAL